MITSSFHTTPTAAIERLVDLPPIVIFLNKEAAKAALRLRRVNEWTEGSTFLNKKAHTRICESILQRAGVDKMPVDECLPVRQDIRNFQVTIEEREKAKDIYTSGQTDHIRVFTDGSKGTDGAAGTGVIFDADKWQRRISLPVGDKATVYQAEVMGILTAADVLLGKGVAGQRIRIHTDSQAAIQAVSAGITRTRLTRDCAKKLRRLAETNEVSLAWVPGHEGVEGNEQADAAAKEGATMKAFGPEPFIPVPSAWIKQKLKKDMYKEWNKEWKGQSGMRQSKDILGLELPPFDKVLTLGRGDIRIITQLATGHAALNRHLAKLGKVKSARCPKCKEEEETPRHFIERCSAYEAERRKTLGENTDLRDIIKNKNLLTLATFVRSTKRLEEWST
jgi:ribonuclease HI